MTIKEIAIEIFAKLKGFTEAGTAAKKTIVDIENTARQAQNNIESAATKTNANTKKSAEELQKSFDKMSLKQLKTELKSVEEQIQKLKPLQEIALETQEYYKKVGQTQPISGRQNVKEITSEMEQLEQQYNAVSNAIQNFNEKQGNQKASLTDSKIGITTAATAARSLASATGIASKETSQLSSALTYLKQMLNPTVSMATKLGTAFAGGSMIAVAAISMLVSHVKKVKEENKKLIQEAISDLSSGRENIRSAETALSVLQDTSATTDKILDSRNEMAKIMPQIVQGYDSEGNAIIANTKEIEKQVKLLKEKERINRQIASGGLDDLIAEYNRSVETTKTENSITAFMMSLVADDSQQQEMQERLQAVKDRAKKLALKNLEDLYESMKAEAELRLGRELPAAVSLALHNGLSKTINEGGKISENFVDSYLKQYENLLLTLPEALEEKANTAGEEMRSVYDYVLSEFMRGDNKDIKLTPLIDLADFVPKKDTGEIAKSMEEALETIINSVDVSKLSQTFGELQEKILNGSASASEVDNYSIIYGKLTERLSELEEALSGLGMTNAGEVAKNALEAMAKASISSSDALKKQVTETKALKLTITDAAKGVNDIYGEYKNLRKEMQDLSEMQKVVDVVKAGKKSTEDYEKAIEYLSKQYSVSESEAAGFASQLEKEIEIQMALAEVTKIETLTKIEELSIIYQTKIARLEEMGATQDQIDTLYRYIDALQKAQILVAETDISSAVATPKWSSSGPKKAKSQEKSEYEKIIAQIEHKRALDQLTYDEELALLNRAKKAYKVTAEQKMQAEEKIYQVKKQQEQAAYDNQVHYNKLSLTQQQEHIKQMIAQYKKGTEARMELERQLYDVQKSQVDKLGDALTTAIKNRYQEQLKAETATINKSIENWQTWANEQVKAIQAQISALDELTKTEDRAEEEAKKRHKIAALEQQLQYTNDDYTKRKLQEQIDSAKLELDKWLKKNEREDLKKELQNQIESVNEKASNEQKALQESLDERSKHYDELMKEANIRAEAEKMLMSKSQTDIINMLKKFAPDYDYLGQSFGEKMVSGFISKVGNLESWFKNFDSQIAAYQKKMASVATNAADQFWKNQQSTQKGFTTPNLTINFNQPVSSPAEMRRELERMLANMSSL